MQHLYMGFKPIQAMPMTRQAYNDFRGWILPSDENGDDAGYLVEYLDGGKANTPQYTGYVSWSPKDVFEKAYRPSGQLTFGMAIEALKMGKAVARAGWNGKGMFVYHVPANAYPAQTGVAKAHFGEGALVPYHAYLALKGVDGAVSTWVPSINDTLAEDWSIL
jgi:hypothetical protein